MQTPYATLYKRNTNGSIQVWQIFHNDTSYWTVVGKKDGKQITSKPTKVTPKSNRTQSQQMESVLHSKIISKTDENYTANLAAIDDVSKLKPAFEPMTANQFDKKKGKIVFPAVTQPKIDGIRCLATKDGLFFRSRDKIDSCLHIEEALKDVFAKYPKLQLDGEIYCHEYKADFNQIVSLVKKQRQNLDATELQLIEKLQLQLFDSRTTRRFEADADFWDRWEDINSLLEKEFPDLLASQIVVFVPTIIVPNFEGIEIELKKHLEEGYEGCMIRNLHSEYVGKRSDDLLKYKLFIDEEFEIVGINEGSGNLAGAAGSFDMRTADGKPFNAKLTGSFDRLRWIFNNPSEVIGKMATIKYQNLTPDGVPRFGVATAIRGFADRSDWV